MLTTWLFERSDYLHGLLSSGDVAAQQKLVAIYHLVKVSAEQIAMGDRSRKGFLNRIRRIEALNQDNAYRAVASEAGDMDAVRVMTIHGSKGLEFRAVHFPAIATRYMPTARQPNRCPPPPSLAKLAIGTVEHDAEEQCLFFVALSRARDFLSLSRAERYTKQNSNASKFLTSIERVVPVSRYEGSGASYSDMFHPHPPPVSDRYEERHLSVYMKCPARYRYEVLEQLYGSSFESPYVQFHRCVYSTIRWLEEQRKSGLPTDPPIALSQLASLWEIHGPTGHAFEGFYRAAAEEMVRDMALAITGESAAYDRGEWLVPVAERKVAVTPDRVILAADGTVHVQRIRTGRETKSETGKPIYALLRLGAEAQYPGKPVAVETYYLSSGKRVLVPDDDDEALLSQYAEAIEGIEAGHFEPRPEPRTCPSCQCYFVCRC